MEEVEHYIGTPFNLEIFKDVKIGDVLVFRNLNDILTESRRGYIGWDPKMTYLLTKELIVDREMIAAISNSTDMKLCSYDMWTIAKYMVEPKIKKEQENINNMADEPKINFSIVRTVEESIIEEMISKIDYARFKKLMSIGSSGNTGDGDLNSILRKWAYAKYDFYLLFGKNLTLETSIELEMSRPEMTTLVEEKLYRKFPRHYAVLSRFDMQEFITNEINGANSSFITYCGDMYKRGKKLSKFIAEYCQDKDLNDALANVLGNRKIVSKIAVSIDPYDYLTMSLNNHRWQSCQKLGEGEFASACLALILDSTTLIGYKYSGENTNYDYHDYEFVGNSKAWRQCVYYDKDTSSILFSRQYPDEIDGIAKALREMMEAKVSEYLGIRNAWTIRHNNSQEYYEIGSELLYHDVEQGAGTHSQVTPKDCKEKPSFVVGKDYNCLSCGESMDGEATTHFLCHRCDEGYEEEWDDEENEEEDA
jgi:hypothetical protein